MDLEKGIGRWRMEAERKRNTKVDFILEAHGKEFKEWAWWNDTWSYKREISNLTLNISALHFLEYDSDMENDFSDIRFLDITETTELNYTIEKKVDRVLRSKSKSRG